MVATVASFTQWGTDISSWSSHSTLCFNQSYQYPPSAIGIARQWLEASKKKTTNQIDLKRRILRNKITPGVEFAGPESCMVPNCNQ